VARRGVTSLPLKEPTAPNLLRAIRSSSGPRLASSNALIVIETALKFDNEVNDCAGAAAQHGKYVPACVVCNPAANQAMLRVRSYKGDRPKASRLRPGSESS